MPSRNILRQELDGGFYHVYARGASKKAICLDETDRQKFINLFARYLSAQRAVSKTGELYPNYHGRVRLLAFCLMGNHFHLFVWQQSQGDLSVFMRSVMTSYVRYFNLRHRQSGSLFESRFKASLIYDDAYLVHISRYIHLNPRSWKHYPYSSIGYYRKGGEPDWLETSVVLERFAGRSAYLQFLYDYEDYKSMFDEIKYDLADGLENR
jgi:REP element-mobilizing transposase RayT